MTDTEKIEGLMEEEETNKYVKTKLTREEEIELAKRGRKRWKKWRGR